MCIFSCLKQISLKRDPVVKTLMQYIVLSMEEKFEMIDVYKIWRISWKNNFDMNKDYQQQTQVLYTRFLGDSSQ